MHTLNLLKFQPPNSTLACLWPSVSLQSLSLLYSCNYSFEFPVFKKASPRSQKGPLRQCVQAPSGGSCCCLSQASSVFVGIPKSYPWPDDRRTQCLDGCMTIWNNGHVLSMISSVQFFSCAYMKYAGKYPHHLWVFITWPKYSSSGPILGLGSISVPHITFLEDMFLWVLSILA